MDKTSEKQQWESDDFDTVWKESLDVYLDWFMKLFFPQAYEEIDWSKGFESMEQELRKTVPESEVGNRYVDKLMKVYRKNGAEAWVYIHIEIQSQTDNKLPERIYIYNCRLYLIYQTPIMSVAVLGDDRPNWRPTKFEYELWGSKASLQFQTVKLLDYRERMEELRQSGNPFAYFIIAHLRTLETKRNPQQRLQYKEALATELIDQGLSEERATNLLRFIDYMMTLPKELERTYTNNIFEYKEQKKMPFITPMERLIREDGIEEGRLEGVQIGSLNEARVSILEILSDRFGGVPVSIKEEIQRIEDITLLRHLRKCSIKVISLEEFVRIMKEVE